MARLLHEETGEMLLSHYGNTFALGFKGDNDFIERNYNFAFNYCATNGALIGLTQSMSYVVTSPPRIMNALKLYYYNEVIMLGEAKSELNEEGELIVDEAAAEKLSMEKAQKFFETKIRKENFMFNQFLNKVQSFADVEPKMV